jgi:RNA polymerase sigma-70 factor (ECF subfamily)
VKVNERGLIARAQRGDASAFEALVNMHAKLVYNLAFRVVNDQHEAEDLAQEAFLRAWRALPRFRGQARFSTWLYRIVTNLCYNRLPHLRRELMAVEPDEGAIYLPDERQGVERALISDELNGYLHQAIAELPEGYRLLITLRQFQEMSYNEIAETTGMPLGTVKTGIFRARKLLRNALEIYEAEK